MTPPVPLSGEPSSRPPRSGGIRGTEDHPMKGILAWLIGIPIPIIILLYLFDVF
jgi:hypothetical protein